ncbi:MAG TPA: ABC transporter substrate-binding protein [Verrucomicrobiae bacterium]|nr:ABC transporter substrate-binding protein [Verrucomicrobiae bacterium]
MNIPLKSFLWSTVAVSLVLLSSPGCNKPSGGGDGAGGEPIKVGQFASLTGKEATFGISSDEGTILAIEEINAAGGVLGRQLKLLTEDTQSKAGEPATVVNKLIARDGVVAILGEVASSRSLEAAPICQQSKVPMVSPSSTNPKVTQVGDYIFRVCYTDKFQGDVIANFVSKSLKAKKAAIFTDVKSDYSKGLAKYIKDKFLTNGGTIVAELDFNGGDKDFKAQLTAIKAANPDAVFVPGYYTDAALICVQAKQLGLTAPFVGGDGWESEKLTEIGKDAVENQYFSTHYHPDVGSELSKKFVENYKKRWNGKTPDALAACGYDSVLVLADAIKRAGSTDGQKIRDALAATKDLQAVTGKITIDENRDANKAAVILQVKDGKYKYLETVEP